MRNLQFIMENLLNMRWLFMLISCVSNVKSLISEEGRIAWQLWMNRMQVVFLRHNNLFVQIVVIFLFKIVQNTAKTSSNSSANFVVTWLNGSVGETPISANHATNVRLMVITLANILNNSYQNALGLENAMLEEIIMETASRRC